MLVPGDKDHNNKQIEALTEFQRFFNQTVERDNHEAINAFSLTYTIICDIYPCMLDCIFICENISFLALHIGQIYGGSSRKTT